MSEIQRCHYEEMKQERKDPYCFTFKLQEKQDYSKEGINSIQRPTPTEVDALPESEALLKPQKATENIPLKDQEHTACPITFTVSVIRDQTVSVPLKEEDMIFDLESKTASDHISTKFYVYPDNEVV